MGRKIRIATLDTMLSFFLAFAYVKRPYYDENRIFCMSQYLFKVQEKNRLKQKGLIKRFSMNCYGKQSTIEKMREEKAVMYKKLKANKGSKEWEWWFLRYIPAENKSSTTKKVSKKVNKRKHKIRKKQTRRKRRKKKNFYNIFRPF